jgi:heme O synthase-like polyprenyltransferase
VSLGAARDRGNPQARRLFLTSVWYLPVLLGLMVLDKAG